MCALVTFRTIFGRLEDLRSGAFGRLGAARSEAGFTLIEALMAAVILVVGLIGLLGLLDISVKASATTRAREGATNLAREIVEDARTIPYAQIIPGSIKEELRKIEAEGKHPLAGTSSSPWQIDRRGFVYTVEVEECAIDNPKDGLAKTHELASAGGTFCEGQENWKEGTVDTEPEDLKRIAAKVSWTFQKRTSTVTQVSTLTAAGQAVGLVARELKLTEPPDFFGNATEPVITKAETELTFSVAFPEGTSAIDWSLEGAKQGEITGLSAATSPATFKWTISSVSDGTYNVSAQAVNSTGVIGPPISIPVRLIRGVPKAPEPIGGFNNIDDKGVFPTEVAELEWKADSERDVIGYRVRGPEGELICPEKEETLSAATSCIDFTVTGKPAERAYTVAALYRNAENKVTESIAKVSIKQVESIAPSRPTNLVAEKNSNGSVTLKWKAPTSGETVSFYRVYRGSQEYTSRYGTTLATECKPECSFTDTDAETTHQYWVTAASQHLTESPFEGPASG